MFFKLSVRNVRKSFKNYMLYFLTLTFGVCVFYIFNSIESQEAMLQISQSQREMLKTLTQLMGVISVFVSIILGFLIVGANSFLIRRRKKELGIYMTLGMGKGKISKLLVMETLLIGIFSLAVGLAAGVFFSQWLSVLTAKLFEVDMTGYVFIFSPSAFAKTILYFGIIFVVVIVASTVAISRYKLIDLLAGERKNEKPRLKNPVLTLILFILSVACLGTAYGLVLKNGIEMFDNMLLFEIILGAIGTFLFFASLSGFFLKLIQSNKNRYYKGLNAFILRQLNSRINTAHISISLICLMLFCTIGILSTGLGMNAVMEGSLKSASPNDVTVTSYNMGYPSAADRLKSDGIDLAKYTDSYAQYTEYHIDGLTRESVLGAVHDDLDEVYSPASFNFPLPLYRLSDYNNIAKANGLQQISLQDGQVAVFSEYAQNSDTMRNALNKVVELNTPVAIFGKNYTLYPSAVMNTLSTSMTGTSVGLIVPDAALTGATAASSTLIFNCKGDSKTAQETFQSDMGAVYKDSDDISLATKNVLNEAYASSRAIISYVGIYLGIIFLITSAAILALQQLSEVADNRRRYAVLKKIGADDRIINGAIFKQTAIYFLLPLALACVHSIVGLTVANRAVASVGNVNALANIVITAFLIALVYGSYFLATYYGGKSLILKNNTRDIL